MSYGATIIQWLKKSLTQWVERPEYVYLWVALISVVGFALITPPFQGPDEQAHYIRVQYLANGFFTPSSLASLPDSIAEVAKITFYTDDIRGRTADKYETERTLEALKIPLNRDEAYSPQMITYSPLPYLPSIPGVILSNALNLSPIVALYAARLLLGAASVALFFFAIKLIPYKKYLLMAVGLIPMMLYQQAMITADSVSYALLALFIAYVLHLRDKKVISSRAWFMLGALCIGVALSKPLVFIFLPLVIVLIKKKSAMRWLSGIAIACGLLLAGWMMVSSVKEEAAPTWGMPDNVNSAEQVELITENPKRALRVMWNTYMTQYGDDEIRGVLGIFGAADVIYPLWMTIGYACLLGILATTNFDQRRVKIYYGWKILAIVLSGLYFILVNYALYTGFTPVNFDIIYGIQGRYFLPILIIAATAIFTHGVTIVRKDATRMKVHIVISAVVLVFLALLITYQRYYLYTP